MANNTGNFSQTSCHHGDSFAGTGCKLCPEPIHCSVSCPLQHLQGELHLPVVNRLSAQAVSVPVGTLLSSLALSFHPEGADVRTVAFVVGSGSGQLQQHVAGRSSFSQSTNWSSAIRIGYLKAGRTQIITCISALSTNAQNQSEQVALRKLGHCSPFLPTQSHTKSMNMATLTSRSMFWV